MNTLSIILESTLPELMSGFRRYTPNALLTPWVQCYWVAQQDNLPEQGISETLYPDGGTSLVFTFNNNQFPHIEFNTTQTTTKIVFQNSVDSIGVRFNPGGAFALFGIEGTELFNQGISSDLPLNDINVLQDDLTRHASTSKRLWIIEAWLLRQVQQYNPSPVLLQHFIPRYLSSEGNIDAFIKHESISRRQLERKFQQEIGLSPAQLKQLHRIKKARYFISRNPQNSLTEVALECGFHDQAHFIHNFQKITGQTPGQYKHRKMSQKYNPINS